jgi:hypothetical protein
MRGMPTKGARGAWFITAICIVLVIIGLALFRPGWGQTKVVAKASTDGFASAAPTVTTCPPGTTYYIATNGDTMCCKGEVVGSRCSGTPICTFASTTGAVPSCSAIYGDYTQALAAKMCPKEMPRYFEAAGRKGCTASTLKLDKYEPTDPRAPTCTIYASTEDNDTKTDSCLNLRRLSDMPCLTAGCKKAINAGQPWNRLQFPLLEQVYSAGGPGSIDTRVCYDRDSLLKYARAAKDQRLIDTIDTSDMVCAVAQRKVVEGRV